MAGNREGELSGFPFPSRRRPALKSPQGARHHLNIFGFIVESEVATEARGRQAQSYNLLTFIVYLPSFRDR